MYQLRPYQGDVLDRVRHAIASGKKRPMVALATGSGKTVIAASMMRAARLRGNRSIFIAERKELVNQARDTLEAAGLQVGIMRGEDTLLRPTDDCIVASIQTIGARWHALPHDIRLAVIDEAHMLHKHHLRLMKLWSAIPFVGLSATPLTKGLGRHFDALIRGPSIADLMAAGHLVGTVRAFAPRQDAMRKLLAGVKISRGDYQAADLSTALNSKEVVGDLPVEWRKHAEGRQTVVFAVDVAHSKSIAADFNAAGIPAAHVDGYMADDERDKIIAAYRAGAVRVLSSVAVLAVGFDAPETSCVILARPTLSETMHIQQAGRGLRPAPGKDDLVVLDHAGNTLRHGLPQFFEAPDLDDGHKRQPAARKKPDRHKPCPQCGYVLERGQVTCPACSFTRPLPSNQVVFADGELVEGGVGLPGDAAPTVEAKRAWYNGLRWCAVQSGMKPGAGFFAYQGKFKEKPPYAWNGDPITEPDDVVKRYFKHHTIRMRKRPRPVPTECNHCGSRHLVRTPGAGPHAAGLRCGSCNRHLKWLNADQARGVRT